MERIHLILVSVSVALAWLLFAGELALAEIIVAVLAGLVTAIGGKFLRDRTGHRQGGLKLWIRYFPNLLLQALKDSWIVSVELFRLLSGQRSQGTFRRLRFERFADDSEDQTRRVVATIGTTLQPNSYVLGFNKKRKEILIHQLVPTPDNPIAEELREKE